MTLKGWRVVKPQHNQSWCLWSDWICVQAHGVPDQTGYVCRLMVSLIRLDMFAGSWCPWSDWICVQAHGVPDQTGYVCRLMVPLIKLNMFAGSWYPWSDWIFVHIHGVPDRTGYVGRPMVSLIRLDMFACSWCPFAMFFHGDWSWNIFYGHSLPSADSRRAVVSFWRKNVHNTG